jgi:hypothetical protein
VSTRVESAVPRRVPDVVHATASIGATGSQKELQPIPPDGRARIVVLAAQLRDEDGGTERFIIPQRADVDVEGAGDTPDGRPRTCAPDVIPLTTRRAQPFMRWRLGKNWRRSDRRLNFQAVDDQVIVENAPVDRIHHRMIEPVSVE